MSRAFNGGTAADSITFSAGNAPAQQGPITVAVLAKAVSLTGWTGNLIKGKAGVSNSWALLTTNNGGPRLFIENDFGNGATGLTTSWAWYCFTKASGSALPRFHVFPLGGSWTHTDGTANVGNNFSPCDTIYVGADGSGSAGNTWRGSIAVAATWSSVLSDTAIQSAMTLNALDTFNANPGWMVRLNQSSTATTVKDDMSGHGDQTAISGTSIDSDDPPGYNYALTPTVTPNGIDIPVTLGQPTVTMAVFPAGINAPVTLGQPTVVGQPYAIPLQGGSWWTLETILDTTRSQIDWWNKRQPVACPNDGEPLRRSVDGILFCPFDNWRPDSQQAVPRRRAVNRDWGHLSGIRQAAARDAVFNQLLLSCPNDGEPLSIDKHGQQYCRYDGWMPDPVN